MTSGADAQADVDRLMGMAVHLGKSRLAEAAEFDPIAILVDADDRLLEVEVDTSALGKHPETEDLIDTAIAQLRLARSAAKGTALVINTRLSKERVDAIEVRLEHRDGLSMVVLLRYKRATFGNRTEYEAPTVYSSPPAIWR